MNKKELYHFLPSLVFLVVLGVLALLLLFGPDKDYSVNEKRYLAERPEISVSNILKGETQEELEEFTADQIPGRDFFVGVNAYWNLATGRNAAQSIYHGKNGYLINAPKPLNEEVFANNLTRFDQFAESLGIPASIIMVPSTGYLMQNELPAFHGTYDDDALYEKAGELLQYTKIIDVRDALKDGVEENAQTCYRTDHHLTSLGNYLLYRAYQIDQGRRYLSRDAYEVTATDGFYGTTWSGSGYWFTKPDTVEVWDSGIQTKVTLRDGSAEPVYSDSMYFPKHLEEIDKYPVFLDGNHSLVNIYNPNGEEGSVLIIRDSYAHCFSTFLAANYQSLYLVDLRYYRDDLTKFVSEHRVDKILYLYGVDNLVSDTNSAWLK